MRIVISLSEAVRGCVAVVDDCGIFAVVGRKMFLHVFVGLLVCVRVVLADDGRLLGAAVHGEACGEKVDRCLGRGTDAFVVCEEESFDGALCCGVWEEAVECFQSGIQACNASVPVQEELKDMLLIRDEICGAAVPTSTPQACTSKEKDECDAILDGRYAVCTTGTFDVKPCCTLLTEYTDCLRILASACAKQNISTEFDNDFQIKDSVCAASKRVDGVTPTPAPSTSVPSTQPDSSPAPCNTKALETCRAEFDAGFDGLLCNTSNMTTACCDVIATYMQCTEAFAKTCEGTADILLRKSLVERERTCPMIEEENACFPAHATVRLENGTVKRMEDVKVGDRVHVGGREYSTVFSWGHRDERKWAGFVKIVTGDTAIELSPHHYIFVDDHLTIASAARVGSSLTLANGTLAAMTSVSYTSHRGVFNPHTMAGEIAINGVKASVYTQALHPTLAHALLALPRLAYRLGVRDPLKDLLHRQSPTITSSFLRGSTHVYTYPLTQPNVS